MPLSTPIWAPDLINVFVNQIGGRRARDPSLSTFAALRILRNVCVKLLRCCILLRDTSSVFWFLSVRLRFLTKCWPAAANVTVRLREREHRRTRLRRACFWPRLSGLASLESPRRRGRVCRRSLVGAEPDCSRLACSSPSLCCRIIRIFTLKALRDSRLFISDA